MEHRIGEGVEPRLDRVAGVEQGKELLPHVHPHPGARHIADAHRGDPGGEDLPRLGRAHQHGPIHRGDQDEVADVRFHRRQGGARPGQVGPRGGAPFRAGAVAHQLERLLQRRPARLRFRRARFGLIELLLGDHVVGGQRPGAGCIGGRIGGEGGRRGEVLFCLADLFGAGAPLEFLHLRLGRGDAGAGLTDLVAEPCLGQDRHGVAGADLRPFLDQDADDAGRDHRREVDRRDLEGADCLRG